MVVKLEHACSLPDRSLRSAGSESDGQGRDEGIVASAELVDGTVRGHSKVWNPPQQFLEQHPHFHACERRPGTSVNAGSESKVTVAGAIQSKLARSLEHLGVPIGCRPTHVNIGGRGNIYSRHAGGLRRAAKEAVERRPQAQR